MNEVHFWQHKVSVYPAISSSLWKQWTLSCVFVHTQNKNVAVCTEYYYLAENFTSQHLTWLGIQCSNPQYNFHVVFFRCQLCAWYKWSSLLENLVTANPPWWGLGWEWWLREWVCGTWVSSTETGGCPDHVPQCLSLGMDSAWKL